MIPLTTAASTTASTTAPVSLSPANRPSMPAVDGLHLASTGRRTWRVVHTRSGLHLPMVTWPSDDLPRHAAEVALAVLGSRLDWTRSVARLRADLAAVASAARDAAVIARAVAPVR